MRWSITSEDPQEVVETHEAQKVLAALREIGEAKSGDVAKKIGIAHSSVSRTLKRLLEEGLVEKRSYGAYRIPEAGSPTQQVLEQEPCKSCPSCQSEIPMEEAEKAEFDKIDNIDSGASCPEGFSHQVVNELARDLDFAANGQKGDSEPTASEPVMEARDGE